MSKHTPGFIPFARRFEPTTHRRYRGVSAHERSNDCAWRISMNLRRSMHSFYSVPARPFVDAKRTKTTPRYHDFIRHIPTGEF